MSRSTRLAMLLWGCLGAMLAHGQTSGTMTQAQAFALGQSAGDSTERAKATASVNAANATQNVGGFTASPPQTSYTSSLSSMLTGGSTTITSCAGAGAANGSAADKNHCEAVNALSSQVSKPNPMALQKNDPLLLQGKQITSNPESIAGSIQSAYSACTTTTTTTAAPFEMQTCEDWAQITTQSCRIGLDIVVDPDYIYQCRATLKVSQTSQCTYGRVVQVDAKHNYQCTASPKQVNSHKCHSYYTMSVSQSGDPNCPAGAQKRISSYSATLAHDQCQGGDWLDVYYTCAITDSPTLTFYTNGTGSSTYSGTVTLGNTTTINFSNCKAVATATGACSNGTCNISVTASIYDWGNYGWWHDGDLTVGGTFSTYQNVVTLSVVDQCTPYY